jgi:hypothetical protein
LYCCIEPSELSISILAVFLDLFGSLSTLTGLMHSFQLQKKSSIQIEMIGFLERLQIKFSETYLAWSDKVVQVVNLNYTRKVRSHFVLNCMILLVFYSNEINNLKKKENKMLCFYYIISCIFILNLFRLGIIWRIIYWSKINVTLLYNLELFTFFKLIEIKIFRFFYKFYLYILIWNTVRYCTER